MGIVSVYWFCCNKAIQPKAVLYHVHNYVHIDSEVVHHSAHGSIITRIWIQDLDPQVQSRPQALF